MHFCFLHRNKIYFLLQSKEILVKCMQENLDTLLDGCPRTERKEYEDDNEKFLDMFKDFLSQLDQPTLLNKIEPYPSINDTSLKPVEAAKIEVLLKKIVVVKLNGGLGTRMGCTGPKSLIAVRTDANICELNFLDMTVQQIENLNAKYKANIPLVLMNSFNTDYETKKFLSKCNNFYTKIYTFEQRKYPRIKSNNYELLCSSYDDENPAVWYPPGHGNFYETFAKSGLLDKFISQGKEYVFISDIENLGATVDFKILQLIDTEKNGKLPQFIMEVAPKTVADAKRSILVQYAGKPKLIEQAQVSKKAVAEFRCAGEHFTFNTNNLWVRLEAIKRVVKSLSLQVIPNKKQITIENKQVEILQLETDAGCAIEAFEDALAVIVPRSRFLPVKTTSDLFLVRSNVFVNNNGHLVINPDRPFNEVPAISLCREYFEDYKELEKRFEDMPNCIELNHLTVSGNVYFAKDVVLKDEVSIIAHHGEEIHIPKGSVLESKILTGSLRIDDI